MDEDIRGFPFFNLTSACEKNKLRAKKKLPALCLPCDKVLSLCTAPEISFFFGGAGPNPCYHLSWKHQELNEHPATSQAQTTMHMYLFSAIYGASELGSCFPQWRGTGVSHSCLGTPRSCPRHPKRWRVLDVGCLFPALAPKAGCEFATPLLLALRWVPELPIKGNVPRGRFALQD